MQDLILHYIKAFILSVVQSLTEFLPISSTAHLLIFQKYLNFDNGDNSLFIVAIQLASVLAVCIHFSKPICLNLFTLNRKESRNFFYNILLAFLPAALVGALAYHKILQHINVELTIASTLIAGGIIILAVEKYNLHRKDKITKGAAFKIGLCQMISLLPGVSRSGATIVGGLLSGLTRKTAVEFSFLVAIPTIFGANVWDFYQNISYLNSDNMGVIIFGFVSTFILSTLVIKSFLEYISTHDFRLIGYYRIIFGIIVALSH